MEFGEVCEVIPWDILALDCKQTLEDEHVCNPRVFKSHESWGDIAKGDGVKYIYVARNPLDAFVSFHKFMYVRRTRAALPRGGAAVLPLRVWQVASLSRTRVRIC